MDIQLEWGSRKQLTAICIVVCGEFTKRVLK